MKKFKTCEAAFMSIGLKYFPEKYACYNEDIGKRELCPFAESDTCTSKELPEVAISTHLRNKYFHKIRTDIARGSTIYPIRRIPIQSVL